MVQKDTQEYGTMHSHVPLIENNEITTRDLFSLLPMELLSYLIDFLDCQSIDSMALSCKSFYQASKESKTLHHKRVQRWMINGLKSNKPKSQMQNYLCIDVENALIKVLSSDWRLSEHYQGLTTRNKQVFFTVMQGIKSLKISCSFLDRYFSGNDELKKFLEVKELTLEVYYSFEDVINFQQIQLNFPNVDTLNLDLYLDESKKLPFTTEDIFSVLPKLKKLVIRIMESNGLISFPRDLMWFWRFLEDERVELRFYSDCIQMDEAAMSFERFNSESEDQEKISKLKERLFFCVIYGDDIPNAIHDNINQIVSLDYSANQNDTLDTILSKIGIFTHLEKLYLNLFNAFTFSNVMTSKPNAFVNLVDLSFIYNSHQCLSLVETLQVITPNLTKLRISTLITIDFWPQSIFQLDKLEALFIANTGTTKNGFYSLLQPIADGKFPRLREFHMPNLKNEDYSESSVAELIAVCDQLASNRPLIRLSNTPEFCQHLLF